MGKTKDQFNQTPLGLMVEEDGIPDNPGVGFCEWAEKNLKVPPGHPLQGQPFRLQEFQKKFLTEAFRPGVKEAGLTTARKSGKSALIAALILYFLRLGWSWSAASVSIKGSIAELLRNQVVALADAAQMGRDLKVLATPAPGSVAYKPRGNRVVFLSADKGSGHAASLDLAIFDELGLTTEKHRGLLYAMRGALGARNGRLVAMSILGDSPLFEEMRARGRAGSAGTVWHEYVPDREDDPFDEATWRKGNPGLGTIKSLEHLRVEAGRARVSPLDVPEFKAQELNFPGSPTHEELLSPTEWGRCVVLEDALPPREGKVWLGLDIGSTVSMSAAVAIWQSGRLEAWGCFPCEPDLMQRGDADGVGAEYQRMQERGEVRQHGRIVTAVGEWLEWLLLEELYRAGELVAIGADRFRKADLHDLAYGLGLLDQPIEWVFRGQGKGHTADGSYDVRALQRLCREERVKTRRSLLIEAGLRNACLLRDSAGNPAINKSRARGRVDVCSSLAIACGMALPHLTTQTEGVEDDRPAYVAVPASRF